MREGTSICNVKYIESKDFDLGRSPNATFIGNQNDD